MLIRGFSEISPSIKPSHISYSWHISRAFHRHCLLQSMLQAPHVLFVEQYFSQNVNADAESGMLSLGNVNSFRTWVSLFLHLNPFSDRIKSFCDTVKEVYDVSNGNWGCMYLNWTKWFTIFRYYGTVISSLLVCAIWRGGSRHVFAKKKRTFFITIVVSYSYTSFVGRTYILCLSKVVVNLVTGTSISFQRHIDAWNIEKMVEL